MRLTVAALSAFIAVAACSPTSADPTNTSTITASTAPAMTADDNKHKVCLGYRQLEQLPRTLIDNAVILVDPASSTSQIEKTSNDIRQAYAQERAWVETQLPTIMDPEVKSAFEAYRTALTQGIIEIEAAGHDGMKIAHIVFSQRFVAVKDKIRDACKGYGPLPRPSLSRVMRARPAVRRTTHSADR